MDVYASKLAFSPLDPCATLGGDADHDGVCQQVDNCPGIAIPDHLDSDGDGVGEPARPPSWPASRRRPRR